MNNTTSNNNIEESRIKHLLDKIGNFSIYRYKWINVEELTIENGRERKVSNKGSIYNVTDIT